MVLKSEPKKAHPSAPSVAPPPPLRGASSIEEEASIWSRKL
jgi:hypothetical protein